MCSSIIGINAVKNSTDVTNRLFFSDLARLLDGQLCHLIKMFAFFCRKSGLRRIILDKASTNGSGKYLKSANELSNDDSLKVRLGTAIDPTDAHAIDVP